MSLLGESGMHCPAERIERDGLVHSLLSSSFSNMKSGMNCNTPRQETQDVFQQTNQEAAKSDERRCLTWHEEKHPHGAQRKRGRNEPSSRGIRGKGCLKTEKRQKLRCSCGRVHKN